MFKTSQTKTIYTNFLQKYLSQTDLMYAENAFVLIGPSGVQYLTPPSFNASWSPQLAVAGDGAIHWVAFEENC